VSVGATLNRRPDAREKRRLSSSGAGAENAFHNGQFAYQIGKRIGRVGDDEPERASGAASVVGGITSR